MQQIVSITSQGQITIPARIRQKPGLDVYKKDLVATKEGKVIIKPIADIMSLAGILNSKSIKNKDIQEIIKVEKTTLLILM